MLSLGALLRPAEPVHLNSIPRAGSCPDFTSAMLCYGSCVTEEYMYITTLWHPSVCFIYSDDATSVSINILHKIMYLSVIVGNRWGNMLLFSLPGMHLTSSFM